MDNLKKGLGKYAADLALIAGATAVAAGAGLIYPPAASSPAACWPLWGHAEHPGR